MLQVRLDRGKYKLDVEKAIKILKKKVMKERVLKEYRERQSYVSEGRKAYMARCHRKHINELAAKSDAEARNRG